MAGNPNNLSSIESKDEISSTDIIVDRRPWLERTLEDIRDKHNGRYILLSVAVISLIIPPSIYITLPLFLYLWSKLSYHDLYKRAFTYLPEEANCLDYFDRVPGSNFKRKPKDKYNKARGSFYLGNVISGAYEAWIHKYIVVRHMLLFGTTGAGKTVVLLGFAFNYLSGGGGLQFNDAKGTKELLWQVFTLARFFGREGDVRAINFLAAGEGGRDPSARLSNTANMFASGTHDELSQITLSMMNTDKGGGGGNKVFEDRAIAMVQQFMPAAVDLRDSGESLLTAGKFRRYLEYSSLEYLMEHPFVRDTSKERIRSYIASLADYRANKKYNDQSSEVTKQFGFAQAYLTRALSTINDTYGSVFDVEIPEADMADFAFNNRIFITMLPALEKAPEEIMMLGKIVLSMLKNASSQSLRGEVEGDKETVLDSNISSYKAPTGIINDEAAFMLPPGFAVTVAQLRSVLYSVVIAGQDYGGLEEQSKGDAQQYVSNSAIKAFLKQTDTGSTVELIKSLFPNVRVEVSTGAAVNQTGTSNRYWDNRRTEFRDVEKIKMADVRNLNMGDYLLEHDGKGAFIQSFYHGFDTEDEEFTQYLQLMRPVKLKNAARGLGALLLMPKAVATLTTIENWWEHAHETERDAAKRPTYLPTKLRKSTRVVSEIDDNALHQNALVVAQYFIASFGMSEVDATEKSASAHVASKPKRPTGQSLMPDGFDTPTIGGEQGEVVIPKKANNQTPSGIATTVSSTEGKTDSTNKNLDNFFALSATKRLINDIEGAISTTETALGATDKEASKAAKDTAGLALAAIKHPKVEINYSEENNQKMKKSLLSWIDDLDADQEKKNKPSK